MPSEIKSKFGTPTQFTINLHSLASSTTGAGVQSTMVDNSTTRWQRIHIYLEFKLGTGPTGNRTVNLFLIKSDGTRRDDSAGASAAAITILNALLIRSLSNRASPATGDVLSGSAVVEAPGLEFGIAVVHDTGVTSDSSSSNFKAWWYGENPEAQ